MSPTLPEKIAQLPIITCLLKVNSLKPYQRTIKAIASSIFLMQNIREEEVPKWKAKAPISLQKTLRLTLRELA